MADTQDVIKQLETIKAQVSLAFDVPPITGAFQYASTVRNTMDPALLKRVDAIMVQMLEDTYVTWRRLTAGILEANQEFLDSIKTK